MKEKHVLPPLRLQEKAGERGNEKRLISLYGRRDCRQGSSFIRATVNVVWRATIANAVLNRSA